MMQSVKPRKNGKMNNVIFESTEHRYFSDNREYPSYSKIMKHFGMIPDYDRFGNEASLNFGKAIHKLCELYDMNDLGDFDPQLEPWLNGYMRFLEAYKPEWELIESPLVSKVWGFGGTPDRFGLMKKASLVDFKSGTEDPAHAIQTGAYEILVEENLKIKVKARYSLYLLPNDFRLIPHKKQSDKSIFIGLAQAYQWKLNHKLTKEN